MTRVGRLLIRTIVPALLFVACSSERPRSTTGGSTSSGGGNISSDSSTDASIDEAGPASDAGADAADSGPACGLAPVPVTQVRGSFVPGFTFKGGIIKLGRYRIVGHQDLSDTVTTETPSDEYTGGVYAFTSTTIEVFRSDVEFEPTRTELKYGESYTYAVQGTKLVGTRICRSDPPTIPRDVPWSFEFSVEDTQIFLGVGGNHVDILAPE